MMIKQKKEIEKACWLFSGAERCVAGFVVSDNKVNLRIASTISNKGYVDIIQIEKSKIQSRCPLTLTDN